MGSKCNENIHFSLAEKIKEMVHPKKYKFSMRIVFFTFKKNCLATHDIHFFIEHIFLPDEQ